MSAVSEEGPEVGEIVLATITNVTRYGAYVALDEYGGVQGFLHISEISTGWVRHIERHVRLNQKAALKVIRVNRERREVDLSLRQVTGEERKNKLIAVKRDEKAKIILQILKAKLSLGPQEEASLVQKLVEKFGGTYEALEAVVRNGVKAWEGIALTQEQLAVVESVSKEKIALPSVSIRGLLEVRCKQSAGIEVIKKALSMAESADDRGNVEVTYIGAPRYRILVEAENYKIAEKILENAVEAAKGTVEKSKGSLTFKRE